jgi:hypothetical protein
MLESETLPLPTKTKLPALYWSLGTPLRIRAWVPVPVMEYAESLTVRLAVQARVPALS